MAEGTSPQGNGNAAVGAVLEAIQELQASDSGDGPD